MIREQNDQARQAILDGLDYYPDSAELLESIYGIGHYTAAAYLSLHRNIRGVLLDSNIARFLARFTGQKKPEDLRRSKNSTKRVG